VAFSSSLSNACHDEVLRPTITIVSQRTSRHTQTPYLKYATERRYMLSKYFR